MGDRTPDLCNAIADFSRPLIQAFPESFSNRYLSTRHPLQYRYRVSVSMFDCGEIAAAFVIVFLDRPIENECLASAINELRHKMVRYVDKGLTIVKMYDQSGNGHDLELDNWPYEMSEDGESARVLSPDRSWELRSHIVFPCRISELEIQTISANLLNEKHIDHDVSQEPLPKIIDANSIKINSVDLPIVKMLKSVHADRFFDQGLIRLGSIDEYRNYDDPEIGDYTEGDCIMVGLSNEKTIILDMAGGLNERILCCSEGNLDTELMEKFGYDAAFEIFDPVSFSNAIGTALQALNGCFSRCMYSDGKVISGENLLVTPLKFDSFSEMLGEARAFIKPARYSHQKEVRFKWSMPTDVIGFADLTSLEATRFCKRIL